MNIHALWAGTWFSTAISVVVNLATGPRVYDWSFTVLLVILAVTLGFGFDQIIKACKEAQ